MSGLGDGTSVENFLASVDEDVVEELYNRQRWVSELTT